MIHLLFDAFDAFDASVDAAVCPPGYVSAPAGCTPDNAHEFVMLDGAIEHDAAEALTRAKRAAKAQVKAAVAAALDALAWRVERAREREVIGAAGESLADVLADREAARRAGNRIEADIDACETRDAVLRARAFVILDVDRVRPASLSPKAFMDRFTDVELTAILAAIEANPAMRTWWARFDKARDVALSDPMTAAGVHALELAGLIAQGRASEILTP